MRKRWLWIAAALVAAALFAAQCAPGIIEDIQRRQGPAHADALMEEGEYEEAHDALMTWFTRGENTDADYARYFLCNAHIAYERGNVDSADTNLRLYADYCPEDQWSEQTQAFVETVAEEAEALAAQQRAEAAAEAAAVRAAYEERVRTEPTVTRSPSPRRDYEEEEEDRFNASTESRDEDLVEEADSG